MGYGLRAAIEAVSDERCGLLVLVLEQQEPTPGHFFRFALTNTETNNPRCFTPEQTATVRIFLLPTRLTSF